MPWRFRSSDCRITSARYSALSVTLRVRKKQTVCGRKTRRSATRQATSVEGVQFSPLRSALCFLP